jgi:DNA repair protein RecO (recombination protein O)
MLVNSRGIVLSTLRYSDSSIIARIYTEVAGLRPFMVRVGKGRGAIGKVSTLQPLSPVAISFDPEQRQGMRTPRSLERDRTLVRIPFDALRSSMAIFMAEVLSRSLQDDLHDAHLFKLINDTVTLLDSEEEHFTDLHLTFLMELTRFLGCHPQVDTECAMPYFDLREGEHCTMPPLHPEHISSNVLQHFTTLAGTSLTDHQSLRFSNNERRVLLRTMITYLRLHVDGMNDIRSHTVLEEVMS